MAQSDADGGDDQGGQVLPYGGNQRAEGDQDGGSAHWLERPDAVDDATGLDRGQHGKGCEYRDQDTDLEGRSPEGQGSERHGHPAARNGEMHEHDEDAKRPRACECGRFAGGLWT